MDTLAKDSLKGGTSRYPYNPDIEYDPIYKQEIIVDDFPPADPPPPGVNAEVDFNPILDPIISEMKEDYRAGEVVINNDPEKSTTDVDTGEIKTTASGGQIIVSERSNKWMWIVVIAIVGYFLYKKYA